MRKKIMKNPRYTLVEIIVATALLSMLGSGALFSYFGTRKAYNAAEDNRNTRYSTLTILELIYDDLRQIVHPRQNEEVLLTQSFDSPDFRADTIQFISLAQGKNHTTHGAACEIGYVSSPAEDKNRIFCLYRREEYPPHGTLDDGGVYRLLSDRVTHFAIRYLENGEWLDMPSRIPDAIQVELGVGSESETDKIMKMTIPLCPSSAPREAP